MVKNHDNTCRPGGWGGSYTKNMCNRMLDSSRHGHENLLPVVEMR